MERISKKFQDYCDLKSAPEKTRLSANEIMSVLHLSVKQLREYEIEFAKGNGKLDITQYTHEEKCLLWDKLVADILNHPKNYTSKDREMVGKALGLLVEKTENKNLNIVVTGDQYADIEREAKRRNTEEGYTTGEGEVQRQPDLLPQEIR